MKVHATIFLTKHVDDLDKADDWFEEVKELLEGKTTCQMDATSTNQETPIQLTEGQPDG